MEYLTIFNEHHAICTTGSFHTVSDHENCLSIMVHRRKQAKKFLRCLGIQCSGRLICQNDLRLDNQRSCHCHTLLLSTRHFVRVLFQNFFNTKMPRDRRKALFHFFISSSGQNQWQENVIFQCKCI